jgi:hypothetical protein
MFIRRRLFLIGLCFSWLFFVAQPVNAIEMPAGTVLFADDFQGIESKWQVTRGSDAMWEVSNGVLEGTVLTSSTITELVPRDEFWSDEWRNYAFELDILPVTGVDRNLAWGYQNPVNWYEVHFLPNFFELVRLRQGQVAWQQSTTFSLTTGVWHHLKISTTGGQLEIWIDGVLIKALSESGYSENPGRIALKVGTGSVAPTKVKFDNVVVTQLVDARELHLNVPAIRQDDPQWAEAEYDSAGEWSSFAPSTISRWGCALTSAVMLLRYHGFEHFLTGENITPLTLNSWLLQQVDGYIAEGWVNWLAIIRLAAELRQHFSTLTTPLPQLQYHYQSWTNWTEGIKKVAEQLRQHQPAILELPGHFVVSNGLTVAEDEVFVRDPASDIDKVKSLGKPIQSGRFFTASIEPELLNLRYWLFVLPRGLRLKIINEAGEPVTGGWLSQDRPGSETERTPLKEWSVYTVPQPPIGEFTIQLDRATSEVSEDGILWPQAFLAEYQPYTVQAFFYDEKAHVTTWQQTGLLHFSPQTWQLQITESDTQAPVITSRYHWQEWRSELQNSWYDQSVANILVVSRLDYTAQLAEVMLNYWREQGGKNEAFLVAVSQRYQRWIAEIFQQAAVTFPDLSESPAFEYLRMKTADLSV